MCAEQPQATPPGASLQLSSHAERGETVASTHGRPVAHLVPARNAREEAVRRFRSERAKLPPIRMSLEELLAARHEGHRY